MINKVSVSLQQLYTQIQSLPQQSLSDLAEYIEFLEFRARDRNIQTPSDPPLRLIKLRGMLSGCDFSPALLAEARREMWQKFDIRQL